MLQQYKIYMPDMDAQSLPLIQGELDEFAKICSPKRQQEYRASKWLRRTKLSEILEIPPESLIFDKTEQGKPFCVSHPEIHFNLSHSGNWVVMAVSDQPIGVDIETPNPKRNIMAIAEHYFLPEEVKIIRSSKDALDMFYKLWTLKEAYVKATGEGIVSGLSKCGFEMLDGKLKPMQDLSPYQFTQEVLEDGTYLALASVKNLSVNKISVDLNITDSSQKRV